MFLYHYLTDFFEPGSLIEPVGHCLGYTGQLVNTGSACPCFLILVFMYAKLYLDFYVSAKDLNLGPEA